MKGSKYLYQSSKSPKKFAGKNMLSSKLFVKVEKYCNLNSSHGGACGHKTEKD